MTRHDLPSGTVTFLFTDVEGSTRLLHELGAEGYADALAEHRQVIREACGAGGGVEVDTQGDAFFFAFPTAPGALGAASAFTAALASGPIAVRVGLHTGMPLVTDEGYVGDDVHFAARVASAGHGGQVICSQATAASVPGPLIDLGAHRLKDIDEPVSIYQLGEGSFPPLKTIANTNLPTPVSSFLGREAELAEADLRLQSTRLLTISGPGGQGKTRFALELARRAREDRFSDYRDGVFSCFLAPLRDPALVLPTIAQSVSVREQPGQSAADALSSHLQGKRMLILLDNLEHVLESASELSALAKRCDGLTLLATSRELLRIDGESAYALPPFADDDSISLFCERAGMVPSREIAELCTRLEGLPLAIELAAARTAILTPIQLLERLSQRLDLLKGGRDADPRQQTLRATIEWSYELLTSQEQQLFARLSVFAGGCTLDAAEEVCDADLDSLQSLVDKSLLRFSDGRFWMLETIREYASERLDDVETQRRYVNHFVRLVSPLAGNHDSMTADAAAMERLDHEAANVRAVLRRLLDQRDGEQALRVAAALAPYWLARGNFNEGLMWVEGALTLDGARDGALLSKALSGATDLSWGAGDLVRARAYATESLEHAERVGEPRAIAQALHDLAEVVTEELDFEGAKALYGEAIRRAREVDYPAPGSHFNLALIAFAEADYELSRALTLRAMDVFRERNSPLGCATGLFNLACVALYSGDVDEARSSLRESIEICMQRRYVSLSASVLLASAALNARINRLSEAASLLAASETLLEEMGSHREATEQRLEDDTQVLIRAELNDSEIAVAWQAGRQLMLDRALSLALASLD